MLSNDLAALGGLALSAFLAATLLPGTGRITEGSITWNGRELVGIKRGAMEGFIPFDRQGQPVRLG